MPIKIPRIDDPLWRLPAVAAYFDVSERTIERALARGEFPQPIRLAAGRRVRLAWYRSTLDAHKARLIADAEARTRAAASVQP